MNEQGAPRLCVTGSGRSGTAYAAELFRACGLNAGHENWWNPTDNRTPGLDVDVSWLAVPHIESGLWKGPVVLSVRHPVPVVQSMLGTNFITSRRSVYTAYALEAEPELKQMPPVLRAVEWWCRWNARAAAVADLVVKVCDLPAPHTLYQIRELTGLALDVDAAPSVPVGVIHHRGHVDVAEHRIWELLDGRAAQFGFGA